MTDAVKVERLELRRVNDIANRDFRGCLRQHITPARAARAGNHSGAPKPKQDLLDVIRRQSLESRDLAAVHRAQLAALRQVERADHAVLGPGRYSHTFTIGF
jgi:hypothetical protein